MFRSDSSWRVSFWFIALCCLLPVWGVLSMAGEKGWPRYLEGADIRPYYTGGAVVLHGQGTQLYDLATQWKWQRHFFPGLSAPSQLLPFLAPPFVAAPMAILASFPVRTAFLVWLGINWVLLSVFVMSVVEALKPRGGRAQMVALVLCVTCAPIFVTLLQGQWAIVLALSSLFSWRALREKRDFAGGLWLALWLFKPQLLLFPLAVLAWKLRGRALGGFALGATALLAVSLAIVGAGGLGKYARLLGEASSWQGKYGVNQTAMFTWRGLLANFHATALWWPGVLLIGAALVWVWRGVWTQEASSSTRLASETTGEPTGAQTPKSDAQTFEAQKFDTQTFDTQAFDARWAMTLLAALFCSPYLYYHDLTLLLVPLLLMALSARASVLGRVVAVLPIVGCMMFWLEFLSSTVVVKVALNVVFVGASFGLLAFFYLRETREIATRVSSTQK